MMGLPGTVCTVDISRTHKSAHFGNLAEFRGGARVRVRESEVDLFRNDK
jgi:hypothetical protein